MNYSERLHKVIPGGAHTYSRGDDQFPINAPQILSRGEGCYVWDGDGHSYLDYGMALRAVTVGYGDARIAGAAIKEIYNGNNLTRPSLVELKAAEELANLLPYADMVKFAKNGSSVTTAAIKMARAYTGRDAIAICSEHPFFSYDDWFIGSTKVQRGVPNQISSMTLKFNFNDVKSVEKLFAENPGKIAALILEPATTVEPQDHFLQKIRDIAHKNGAILILDEMITGFRWHLEGAQKYYGVEPDLATFGKAMANGFSVAALTGKRDIMNIGGILSPGSERVFLMSSTHGAEMCGLGALVETIAVYKEQDIIGKLWDYGAKLIKGVNEISRQLGLEKYFYLEGVPCSPSYVTKNQDLQASFEFRTLFQQEMIKEKILIPWISICAAHGERELGMTLEAVKKALTVYSKALNSGVEKFLVGPTIKPVFRPLN